MRDLLGKGVDLGVSQLEFTNDDGSPYTSADDLAKKTYCADSQVVMAETAQMIKIPGTHPSVFNTVGRPNTPIPMVDLIPMILARNL